MTPEAHIALAKHELAEVSELFSEAKAFAEKVEAMTKAEAKAFVEAQGHVVISQDDRETALAIIQQGGDFVILEDWINEVSSAPFYYGSRIAALTQGIQRAEANL